MDAALARGARITGAERQQLAVQVGERYAVGESIRAIAEDTGRSFGFVHGLVKESGVTIRGRGGATRGAAAAGRTAIRAAGSVPAAQEAVPKLSKGKKPAKDKAGKKSGAKEAEAAAGKGKKSKSGKGQKAGKGGKSRS